MSLIFPLVIFVATVHMATSQFPGGKGGKGGDGGNRTALRNRTWDFEGDTNTTWCLPSNVTSEDVEGPYYYKDVPARHILYNVSYPYENATEIKLTGKVLNLESEPLSHVYLDFWSAGPNGGYSQFTSAVNRNNTEFRGGVYTQSDGSYEVWSLVPGSYADRPAHLHVKVWIDGQEVLTTQIYWMGFNGSDPWYCLDRAVALQPVDEYNSSYWSVFDFVGDWKQPQILVDHSGVMETAKGMTFWMVLSFALFQIFVA